MGGGWALAKRVGCIEFYMGKKSYETLCLFLSAVVVRESITSNPLPMPVGWLK